MRTVKLEAALEEAVKALHYYSNGYPGAAYVSLLDAQRELQFSLTSDKELRFSTECRAISDLILMQDSFKEIKNRLIKLTVEGLMNEQD